MKYDYEYFKRDINGFEIILIRSAHYQELYKERIALKKKHNVNKMAFTFDYMVGDKKFNDSIGNEINDEQFYLQNFDLFPWEKDSANF